MKTDAPLTSCDLGSVVALDRVVEAALRPLYPGCPSLVGPAFTVEVSHDDNLAFHQAVYEAPPGSVIVAVTHGSRAAVAGGRVCAVAQARGIAGFVIDGMIRDVVEIEALGFPVYARGTCPVPGTKTRLGTLGSAVHCGGVEVHPLDLVVADRDGIVVLPADTAPQTWTEAQRKADQDRILTLEQWQDQHRKKTQALVQGPQ